MSKNWIAKLGPRASVIAMLTTACNQSGATAVIGACGMQDHPAAFGINLSVAAPWNGDRPFMNLLVGAEWVSVRPNVPWSALPPERLTPAGLPTAITEGEDIAIVLTPPYGSDGPVRVECRYEGSAIIEVGGVATAIERGSKSVRFTWSIDKKPPERVWLRFKQHPNGLPPRLTDCREQGADRTAIFHPAFLDFIKAFSVIRFMEWSRTNDNRAVTWTSRTRPDNITQSGPDGIAREHQIALANLTGKDAWITLPWNADDSYLRGLARLASAQLARDLKLYIEVGNEVWNPGFPVAGQARREGQERGLTPPQLHRYAQRSMEVFAIFTEAFRDRPKDLVRVIATQNANPGTAEEVLSFPGVIEVTDALATAPYFGHSRKIHSGADVKTVLSNLLEDLKEALALAERNREIAQRHNLRFLAYEGGQHVLGSDTESLRLLERDPEMERLYLHYLQGWRRIGDLMVLYTSTSPASRFGAFGLREWSGQDLSDTPKLRAVLTDHRNCSVGARSHD